MTTEPKDELGGDFAQQNGPKASDPPPVREAVAWRVEHIEDGHVWFAQTHDRVRRIEKSPHHFRVTPLYADPLPVSREAVARIIQPACPEMLDEMLAATDTPEKREYILRNWFGPDVLAKADAILALTGETSR